MFPPHSQTNIPMLGFFFSIEGISPFSMVLLIDSRENALITLCSRFH
jgi:hypothetical protein